MYKSNTLQFLAHEEGRIRTRTPNRLDTLYYDYFIKDHLGNVRMVLTEEVRQDGYPAATMETASATTEEAVYANLSQTRVDKPAGYPYDPYLDPNGKVAKVRGDGQKIGPAITLKVMAGDRFNLRVSSWYATGGVLPQAPNPITDLVGVLATSFAGVSGGKAATQELTGSGVLTPGVNRFLSAQPTSFTKPKAFVNWVLFDEQFQYVGASSGAEPVGGDGELTPHLHNGLPVEKNGYLYVYVSNETPNLDVFFDNLQVTHTRGPLLEETHYYPFGLTMAGISSKAAVDDNYIENNKKYNGIELENDLELQTYDAYFRELDPQTGRWWQVDPKTEKMEMWSPYVSNYDNPITYSDPLGDEGETCCKLGWSILGGAVALVENATGVNLRTELAPSPKDKEAVEAYNNGQNGGDAASIVIGAIEMVGGNSAMGGGAAVTVGTGGTGSAAGVPMVLAGFAMTAHGGMMMSKGSDNLASQKGRVEAKQRTYQTYTKEGPNGEIYTGRTSGTNTPEKNIRKRDENHHMNKKGYGPAELDKTSTDPKAIRGREQKMIDANGGAQSTGGTSGNAINGIGKNNKKKDQYISAAERLGF